MKLATQEQIVTNVIQDTMVMELHVLPVVLTRLHLQVVLLQLQQSVSFNNSFEFEIVVVNLIECHNLNENLSESQQKSALHV